MHEKPKKKNCLICKTFKKNLQNLLTYFKFGVVCGFTSLVNKFTLCLFSKYVCKARENLTFFCIYPFSVKNLKYKIASATSLS